MRAESEGVRAGVALAGILTAACAAPATFGGEAVFHRPAGPGSDATSDPFSLSLQYVLDSAQVESFETDDFDDGLETVLDHLGSPLATIRDAGGFREFLNTEVMPIDLDELSESKAILPNVVLHAFGGGLVYRKNAEWFEAHGVPAPYLVSGTLAMVTEVLGEATEKPNSDATDEIADVYLYRPLGLWLYSDDDRARRIRDTFDPVVWPNLLMWSVEDEDFVNLGLSYAVRPPGFGTARTRPFAYFGITNLVGLSHTLEGEDALSWGLGTATETVDPTKLRFSAGVFYDRGGSLLASLLLNGAEGYAARANFHPGVLLGRGHPLGLFVAVGDEGDAIVGAHYRLPAGLAR